MPPSLQSSSLSVVSSSRVVHARDEAQAAALLIGCGICPSEAGRMAMDVLDGRLLLLRADERVEHDEFSDVVADVPLLSAMTGGQP